MLNHIRLVPFITGIIIGILIVIVIKPQQTIVYKYPTPETADKLIYKDKNDVCYKYSANKLDCDKNESRLKIFPLSK